MMVANILILFEVNSVCWAHSYTANIHLIAVQIGGGVAGITGLLLVGRCVLLVGWLLGS